MKKLLVLLSCLSCIALLAGCINTKRSNVPLKVLQDAPEFELKNVRGGLLGSKDFKGKVLVIDFWATWCVPCKIEIPHYNKLRAKFKDQGVEFLGVTFESGSNMEKILESMKDLEMEYPVGMATDEIDVALGGHQGFPTTFVVGKDWKVYRKTAGSLPGKIEQLEKDINELLAMSYD